MKSVDFTAFEINVKTIAPTQKLYQSGHAIWWYVAPTIINTFLESYDFSGKKIVLFATSGGSGFGNTIQELQGSAPGAVIEEGEVFNKTTKQKIAAWVEHIM